VKNLLRLGLVALVSSTLALLNLKFGDVKVIHHSLNRFQEKARGSERVTDYMLNHYGEKLKTKRGSLQALFKELNGAVPVIRKNRLRQLLENGCRDADYFTAHGWIYVVEEGGILKTCYEKEDIRDAGYTRV